MKSSKGRPDCGAGVVQVKEGDNRGGQRGELRFTCSGALEAFEQTLGREERILQ